jgi:hypothetical protein
MAGISFFIMNKLFIFFGFIVVLVSNGCNSETGQATTPTTDQVAKNVDGNSNISPEVKAKIDTEQKKGSERGRAAAQGGGK